MKNTVAARLVSAFLLIAATAVCGFSLAADPVVFEQNRTRYVIDSRSGQVAVYLPDGSLLHSLGSPAAGPGEPPSLLPQEVIRYLLSSRMTISGLVWDDRDGDGIPGDNEPGLAGVFVFADIDDNGLYSTGEPAALTGALGEYTIKLVKKGRYTIHVDSATTPADYHPTTPHPLQVGQPEIKDYRGIDFGFQEMSASVIGTVWNDSDRDKSRDNGEQPIAGAHIYLDLNGNHVYSPGEPAASTDSSGNYRIEKLPRGTYTVRLDSGSLPAAYHPTPITGSNPTTITLDNDATATVSFGFLQQVTISGRIVDARGNALAKVTLFIDLNGNGLYDDGEPLTTTNAMGYFIFANLYPGTYAVMILPGELSGYDIVSAPGPATLAEGENLSADFVIQAQPGTIASYVWDDENGNSRRDTGENGLAGVTVFLDGNGNGVLDRGELSTETDPSGAYAFRDITPGSYLIRADTSAVPNNYVATTANPVHSSIGPGQIYDGARFGFQRKLAPVNSIKYPTRLSWAGDGTLYVSDNVTGSVFIFDHSLSLQGELKGLAKPVAVVTDGAGNILVGSQQEQNVAVYDAAGTLLRTMAEGTVIPNDLALDQEGNIYVMDSERDTVMVYGPAGDFKSAIGGSRIGYGVSIAINYRDDGAGTLIGELYVADQEKCTIHIFALDGAYKQSAGTSGSLMTSNWDGRFSGLVAVDTDQYGNIHGLDNNLNVVQVFEPVNGTFLHSYEAYLAENEENLNLQTDLGINPADNRVISTNVFTRNIELIHTVP